MIRIDTDALLSKVIDETTLQLTKKSTGKNSIIRKIYFLDSKKWYDFNKPDDFGDILPFISAAENSTGFAKEQYRLWEKRMVCGFPIAKHKIFLPPFLELSSIDDFLFGLCVLYKAFDDKFFLEKGTETSRNIIKALTMGSGIFASVSLPFIYLKLPSGMSPLKPRINNLNYFAGSSSSGLAAESILDFGIWSSDKKLIDAGKGCIDAWISTPTFRKHGLFPEKTVPKDSNISILPKGNTNPGYAILKYAKYSGDPSYKKSLAALADTIIEKMRKDDGFALSINLKTNKLASPSIVATNAFCRFLFEISFFIGDKYKHLAQETLLSIFERAYCEKTDNIWKQEMIEDDAIGDFANVLMVLDDEYKHAKKIEVIFHDLIDRFYIGDGIWKDLYQKDKQQTAHSKYLGGVLKFLVTYKAYRKKENLLSEKWFYITKDR